MSIDYTPDDGKGPLTPTKNSGGDISIISGTNRISGWESASVTCSAEAFPRSFAFTSSDGFPNDPGGLVATPGAKCTILIGDDVVITGYVDRYSAAIRPDGHDIAIVGRGLCEDLLDGSVDLVSPTSPVRGGSIAASNLLDLAKKVAASYKLTVISAVKDLGKPIEQFQVAPGETAYECIETAARYTGYLVYENEHGQVVLDRIGTTSMASGFVQGTNVEAASVSFSVEGRFTEITAVYSTVSQTTEGAGVDVSTKTGSVKDDSLIAMGRYRSKIVMSTQTDNTPDYAQRLVNWMMARSIGRSQVANITCDSWRDRAGNLWRPNALVNIQIPALKLFNVNWIIGTVTFRKDASGTHADLVLMPPDAFSIEPSVLNVFDYEINKAQQPTTGTKPPTTSPAATAYTPGAVPRGDG